MLVFVLTTVRADTAQLVTALSSRDWQQRAHALAALLEDPGSLKEVSVRSSIIATLKSENALIESTLRSGVSMSDTYGEDYSEYYDLLLTTAIGFANLTDPQTAQVLVSSAFNPDSTFAQELAEYGDWIVPALVSKTTSDVSIIRQSALSFIGQIVGVFRPSNLSSSNRDKLLQVLVGGTSDPDPGVQEVASYGLHLASAITPALKWPSPSNISFGTALGSRQLNATSSVPGTFAYSPPTGTVLALGDGQKLLAIFTPADATKYNPSSISTTINVVSGTASGVQLIVTNLLSRDSNQNINVQLTLANAGGTSATNVVLSTVRVGSVIATPTPQALGTIAGGSLQQATAVVPNSVGVAGTPVSLVVSGSYDGGSFSVSSRVALP